MKLQEAISPLKLVKLQYECKPCNYYQAVILKREKKEYSFDTAIHLIKKNVPIVEMHYPILEHAFPSALGP